MPVKAGTPEPLKKAVETMEASVQSFKKSLPFAAPEQYDGLYIVLQHELAAAMGHLYEEAKNEQHA
jgi:hypothetical protein